jgi:hypothetical protein
MTAVQLMNNDVLATFEAHGARIEAVLSDNGREFCGARPSPLRAVQGRGMNGRAPIVTFVQGSSKETTNTETKAA